MPLVLAGATSGSTTLQATDAVTQTITLPNNTGTIITTASSGQSIPKAALPTGSVLQVVNAVYSTSASKSGNTLSDTGLTASITPTSSSSKVLVLVTHNGCRKETSNTTLSVKLLRNSSVINSIEGNGGRTADNSTLHFGGISFCVLDTPATTSSVTYKTQFLSTNNTDTVYINDGFDGSNPASSTITLMEIAA